MGFFGRGKNKLQAPVTIRDMYASYIKGVEESSPYYVTYKEYIAICSDYLKLIANSILSNTEIKLPFKLGILRIVKYKTKITKIHQPVDWYTTAKVGKLVTNYNTHSDGYRYMMRWHKKANSVSNIECYSFILSRANKRKEAALIKNREIDYFELK